MFALYCTTEFARRQSRDFTVWKAKWDWMRMKQLTTHFLLLLLPSRVEQSLALPFLLLFHVVVHGVIVSILVHGCWRNPPTADRQRPLRRPRRRRRRRRWNRRDADTETAGYDLATTYRRLSCCCCSGWRLPASNSGVRAAWMRTAESRGRQAGRRRQARGPVRPNRHRRAGGQLFVSGADEEGAFGKEKWFGSACSSYWDAEDEGRCCCYCCWSKRWLRMPASVVAGGRQCGPRCSSEPTVNWLASVYRQPTAYVPNLHAGLVFLLIILQHATTWKLLRNNYRASACAGNGALSTLMSPNFDWGSAPRPSWESPERSPKLHSWIYGIRWEGQTVADPEDKMSR